MITHYGFIHRLKVRTTLYRIINSTPSEVLLSGFHLSSHTPGFYPQGHLLQLLSPRHLVTLFCRSLSSLNQDDGDGDSDIESKDLDLPIRDPVHLRTDKKFDDAYISQKELGKYVL